MNPIRQYPHIVVLCLLTISLGLFLLVGKPTLSDVAGIVMKLPPHSGAWQGYDILYCHNQECLQEITGGNLAEGMPCPFCAEPMHTKSTVERDALPPDTRIVKKRYARPPDRAVMVTAVLSGAERASIHRPQRCLVGQGLEILGAQVLSVPLPDRNRPLKIMVLDTLSAAAGPEGPRNRIPRYYAYWFIGQGRETPHHAVRMFWLAWDQLWHNVSHRWAYISVEGQRQPESGAHLEELREFVSLLHPQIVAHP